MVEILRLDKMEALTELVEIIEALTLLNSDWCDVEGVGAVGADDVVPGVVAGRVVVSVEVFWANG